uniref:Si:dkey-40g16.5 n=1 Tax=Paramormyrops kingsleyae TaxID=1676925 RepID=A0A3B3Q854_9TELE
MARGHPGLHRDSGKTLHPLIQQADCRCLLPQMAGKRTTFREQTMDTIRTRIKETMESSIHSENPPSKKNKVTSDVAPTLNIFDGFEALIPGANKEVGMLLSDFAKVMRERSELGASQVRELEDIVKEARGIESHLREKKEQLRRSLAVISDKLQG